MPTFTFNNQSKGTSYVVLDPLFGINPVPTPTPEYFSGATFTSFSNISRDDIVVNDYKLGIIIPQGNSSFEFTPSTSIPIPDVIIRGAGDCSVTYVDGATTINITPEELNQSVIPGGPTPPAGYNNQYSFSFDQTGATVGDKEFFNRANTPSLNLTDDFTLSIWVKAYIADPPDDSKIFDNATGGNGFLLYHDDIGSGKWNFELRNSTGPGSGVYRIRSTSTPVPNAWTHLAGTFKNGTGKIYVNGVLETTTNIGIATIGQNTSAEVRIGANDSGAIGSIQAYSGSLQNCSLWNTEFSQSDIDELYNGGVPEDLNNHTKSANGVSWWQIGGDGTGDNWNGVSTWTVSNSFTGGVNYDMSSQGNMDFASRVSDVPS
tara:strand:+ start:1631 stop:2755 length:1125 start_codon:yes stop_codon:yes gene_type:complete